MSDTNKLKEQMNKEIKIIINKYNAAVFVLNGGSIKDAIAKYSVKCPGKATRSLCKNSNPDFYNSLASQEKNKVYYTNCNGDERFYTTEVKLQDLRKNKHLFIGKEE